MGSYGALAKTSLDIIHGIYPTGFDGSIFYSGVRPRNLKKEDELVKESQISLLTSMARHRLDLMIIYFELGRLNYFNRHNQNEYLRIERLRRRLRSEYEIDIR